MLRDGGGRTERQSVSFWNLLPPLDCAQSAIPREALPVCQESVNLLGTSESLSCDSSEGIGWVTVAPRGSWNWLLVPINSLGTAPKWVGRGPKPGLASPWAAPRQLGTRADDSSDSRR